MANLTAKPRGGTPCQIRPQIGPRKGPNPKSGRWSSLWGRSSAEIPRSAPVPRIGLATCGRIRLSRCARFFKEGPTMPRLQIDVSDSQVVELENLMRECDISTKKE